MEKSKKIHKATTDEQVELYNTIKPLVQSVYNEIKELSKKKQDDFLNIGKVKMINRLLTKAKEILKEESTIDYLDLLEEEQLPSNSDAVFIVSQYNTALEKFKTDHFQYNNKEKTFTWDNPGHWTI